MRVRFGAWHSVRTSPAETVKSAPWGGRNLAACTNHVGRVANKLKALPFTNVVRDGDDGVDVVFDEEHFEEVARIMKPQKRRRLSASEREKRTRRLQEYWGHRAMATSSVASLCKLTPQPPGPRFSKLPGPVLLAVYGRRHPRGHPTPGGRHRPPIASPPPRSRF